MLKYRHLAEVWSDAAEHILNPPIGPLFASWPSFNRVLGGMRPHEVTLLCAPTGAGKTQLLASMSAQLLLSSVPHFVAPVETGDVDYCVRVASALSQEDLNTGIAHSAEKITALTKSYLNVISNAPMWFGSYSDRVECEEMINMLQYQHQEHGVKIALLDNLNFFLKVTSTQMEKAEMDNAIHEFIMLVKKIPIHVLLIVHPKKTEGGRVTSEFDIKGSSTAVQEAQNVCLFNRPEQSDIDNNIRKESDRELVFKKIRKRGHNVNKKIWFQFFNGRYWEEQL